MEQDTLQQLHTRFDALERRMEAILLKLNVIDIRVDLMEARFDHRFDLTDEHLAFIKQLGIVT